MSTSRSIFRHPVVRAGVIVTSLMLGASGAAAQPGPEQRNPEQRADASKGASPGVLGLLPAADAISDHVLDIAGQKLAYTATAGTFSLYDGNGERSAAVYYTAYVLKDALRERRPVTFVFNGGPGAASAYLHLGLVGPRIIHFDRTDGGAAQLKDNPDTWLSFTDLVLIDPVGTGWSRAAKPDNNGAFWGVRQDASALAKVIALYTARNSRGSSPKYLLGESYGGFRAVKVARALQSEQGILTSGIAMVSPFLEGGLQWGATRFALGAALQLPSLVAAKLDREGKLTPEALAAAERFAITDYLVTLAGPPPRGEEAERFYARVAEMTGLPLAVVSRARGFVRDAFAKQVREGRAEVTSAYDAAFVATDPFPESVAHEGPDPMLDGFLQALGGAFTAYARDQLAFKTDMTFMLLNREVSGKWDWGGGGRTQASATNDLREYLALNPSARVLIGHGRSDTVTPYGVSRYILHHLPPFGLAERVELKVYKGGHMFYLDAEARREATADARALFGEAP